MTYLETVIKTLTLCTPSGRSCRIGNASFTVRYCSDIWEWEFQGETFWDVHDLAEAIVRSQSIRYSTVPSLSHQTEAKGRTFKTKLLRMKSSMESVRIAPEIAPR
jgi:hypothetical protein